MKKQYKRFQLKIKSQSGASITYALLLFLVCAVVSSVILAAGTAAAGRISQLVDSDQRYYAVSSAANLLKETFEKWEVRVDVLVDKDEKIIESIGKYYREKIKATENAWKTYNDKNPEDDKNKNPKDLVLMIDLLDYYLSEQVLPEKKWMLVVNPSEGSVDPDGDNASVSIIETIDKDKGWVSFEITSPAKNNLQEDDPAYTMKMVFIPTVKEGLFPREEKEEIACKKIQVSWSLKSMR